MGGRVHVNGLGQDRGSVSSCLAISDKRNGLSGSQSKTFTLGRLEQGLKGQGLDVPEIDGSSAAIRYTVSLGYNWRFRVESPVMALTHQSAPVSSLC